VQALGRTEELVAAHPDLKERFETIKKDADLAFVMGDFAKVAKSIRHGSERAAEIIQGMRTFSRLDEAQLKETDLHRDLDMTLMLLRNQYKDRIEIHKEYGELPTVTCFSSQLNQVFMNLLHNAIQAIAGKGDIWVRTRADGDRVVVEIRDNGVGIPKENMPKIFDPFFTSKEVGKGTGLGLSITYGIVERHEGKIEVTSEVGQGTTFRVTLPLKGPSSAGGGNLI
jgi:signal transduction histidine kinase